MKPESVYTEQLLNGLGLAIDEAKLVRELIKSQGFARNLKEENLFSERLIYLNKEIRYIEAKLDKVRSKASGTVTEIMVVLRDPEKKCNATSKIMLGIK